MRTWTLLLLLLVTGCDEDGELFDDEDAQRWIDPIEYHLAATSTAAWMAMVTQAVVVEGSHPCATVELDEITTLTIAPGVDCPHPLLEELEGEAVLVLRPEEYLATASAAGLSVGGRSLLAREYSMLQIVPQGDLLTVILETTDYDDEQNLWGWVVRVHSQGTAELTDDHVELQGGTFAAEALPEDYANNRSTVSLTALSLLMMPECRRNPTFGSFLLEGHSSWPLLDVRTHEACDGQMHIDSTEQEEQWRPTLDLLAGQ